MSAQLSTKIWREVAQDDNPFAADKAFCYGYDVFRGMVGQASPSAMLYLLFVGEPPSRQQAQLLDALAVALANPGPRDPSIHAAMCGGVGGSHAASALMAALATGAGQVGGAREVFLAMKVWATFAGGPDASLLRTLSTPQRSKWLALEDSGWPEIEGAPGFDLNGARCGTSGVVKDAASVFAHLSPGWRSRWLFDNLAQLEAQAGLPVSMMGVVAAAFGDLNMSPEQGEMLCLLLRLPGAAAHAIEQRANGFKGFPFPSVELLDDPKQKDSNHE